jgi:hypothetical protein
MLHFFRHIRKTLMEQNKTRTYIFYALGEIALVMIGILLALQVSNWNQQHIEYQKSINYHQRINEELKAAHKEVSERVTNADEHFKYMITAIAALKKKKLEPEEVESFEKALKNYFKFELNVASINAYDEMISAGELDKIYGLELRNLLAELHNFQSFYLEVHTTFHQSLQKNSQFIEEYVEYILDADAIDESELKLLYNFDEMAKDDVFLNKLSRISMLWVESLWFQKKYLRDIEKVQKVLKAELETLTNSV